MYTRRRRRLMKRRPSRRHTSTSRLSRQMRRHRRHMRICRRRLPTAFEGGQGAPVGLNLGNLAIVDSFFLCMVPQVHSTFKSACILIPIFPLNHPIRGPTPREHLADVSHEQLGYFIRSEVPAPVVQLGLEDDVAEEVPQPDKTDVRRTTVLRG